MATQLEADDYIEDEQPLDVDDEPPAEDEGGDVPANDDTPPADDDTGDYDVVGFGDQAIEAEDEPEGVRNLRKRLREREEELRALKGQPKVQEVGPKPTLEDFDYDDERYDEALLAWHESKRAVKERETQEEAAKRRQREKWEEQERELNAAYTDLRAPGKDSARAKVEEALPGELTAYVVKAGGKNAAALMYALGNAPEKLNELSALAAEGMLAEMIARAAIMGTEVNVSRRKPTTAPEQERRGGNGGVAVNSTAAMLEKLEKEADKTGDRSKLIAYRRKLKEAGK